MAKLTETEAARRKKAAAAEQRNLSRTATATAAKNAGNRASKTNPGTLESVRTDTASIMKNKDGSPTGRGLRTTIKNRKRAPYR